AREAIAPVLRRKGRLGRLAAAARVRPRHLRPVPALALGLRDPVTGLSMGESADRLARDFGVSREEQDRYAVTSHQRAAAAIAAGKFKDEIVPLKVRT
ncbi:acetyl-CoA C-acyltransferase, partial [Citrobacter sp. AAK_AS5]